MKIISKILLFLGQLLLFVLLTALTQIGGIVYFISLGICRIWKRKIKFKGLLVFLLLYASTTLLIVPHLAPVFGREKVKHGSQIAPANWMSVLLNRNYVRPELNALLQSTAKRLEGSGIRIHYLDANFPFINKFPLPPYLSHNDGKKLDICLIYETLDGKYSSKQKSISGYGVFEGPKAGETNQIKMCKDAGYFQYDYAQYLSFGSINSDLQFSTQGTQQLISALLQNNSLQKIFIEPHLKQRLKLTDGRIRYHGCRAVRHDDHIHLQIK